MSKKTVLILINYYLPGYKSGGPIQTISNTVAHLGDEVNFKIITLDRDATDKEPYQNISTNEWNKVGKANVFYLPKDINIIINLVKVINTTRFDYMYLNSFFNPIFTLVPLLLKKINLIPNKDTIVASRGEFSSGALSLKKTKKKLGISLFKLVGLFNDVRWQASSEFEKKEIKQVMNVSEEKIIVAPNLPSPIKKNSLTWQLKKSNVIKLVFLSRITPKKNLDYALEILKNLTFPVEFTIVGPIRNDNYWEKCKYIIESLPSNINVIYLGSIPHNKVIETVASSDLFFFPTKGENYGHVILEAAMAGTPLLISDATPWVDLEKKGVGWELPLDRKKDFITKIKLMYEMDKNDHKQMRRRVKNWALSVQNNADTIEKNKLLFS